MMFRGQPSQGHAYSENAVYDVRSDLSMRGILSIGLRIQVELQAAIQQS